MISCILLSHGRVAQTLIEACEQIVGDCTDVYALNCEGLSPMGQRERIIEFIETHDLTNGLFVFVGLRGGSCWNAAARIAAERPGIEVISGMNLPMLLTFVTKRSQYSFEEFGDVLIHNSIWGISRLNYKKDT